MRLEESIRIGCPRERVWDYVSNPTRYDDFMDGFGWEHVPGEPESGMRARYKLSIDVVSIDLGGVIEVIEWDPPHELAWTSITGIDQRGRWVVRDRGDESELTIRLSYQVPGGILALVAGQLGLAVVRREVKRSLENLKDRIEGGAA